MTKSHPLSGVKYRLVRFARRSTIMFYLNLRNAVRFGSIKIFLSCEIQPALPLTTNIPHPIGIVASRKTEIGDYVTIRPNVVFGTEDGGHPVVADHVTIGANATIIGDVSVGEGATIGAGATVITDVPANTTVTGTPARPVENKDAA